MKPDFVIITSRLTKTFQKGFDEFPIGDLDYVFFFPKIEPQIKDIFSEFGLLLQYKGKTKNVFPNTIMWGKESGYALGGKSRTGEIELFGGDGGKAGILTLTFTYNQKLTLVEPPKFSIKRL